jgi:hypothetical protein
VHRLRPALLALLLVVACGGDEDVPSPRDLPNGLRDEGALLRLPSDGGEATLYRADSLLPLEWRVPRNVPPIARALGTDLEDEMVYAVDREGEVVGIDLRARQSRPYLTRANHLSGTADGAVLGLDSARRPLRFAGRNLTVFRATVVGGPDAVLVPASGGRMVAYAPSNGTVQVLEEAGEVRRLEMPVGELTTSWAGDLLAVTTDSGLAFAYPSPARAATITFVRLRGSPITSAFSPSGHRIYVARARGDVAILDRFNDDFRQVGEIELPAPARQLRIDRAGRWLLARPAAGDSVWLVDLVRRELVSTVATPWADDLPLVSGGRSLVMRDGDDVEAWDLTGSVPEPRTRLHDAAGDVFLAIPWRPRESRPAPPPPAEVVATVPEGAPADSAAAPADSAEAAPSGEIFIQVTSSQNRTYASALADQLGEIGFRSRVRDPESEGDGFRVLVGPYGTREEAEADGRRLGRPYFIRTSPGNQP